jgi:hypothetical protein
MRSFDQAARSLSVTVTNFFGAFGYCGGVNSIYSRKSFDPEHAVKTIWLDCPLTSSKSAINGQTVIGPNRHRGDF